ncbi:hypothetical protein JTB14_006414 [Gonioctena quinquepunctata]|nr:hypothetical protein JTB14_006414 [Gonioctena quinquepunctata]
MKKQVRASKHDPLVEEVESIESNEEYASVRLANGRETTVSIRHLAPCPECRTTEDNETIMDNMEINNRNTDNSDTGASSEDKRPQRNEIPLDYSRDFVTF